LWLILITSTIFLLPLISLRVSNEIKNDSVILACDYQKFVLNGKLSDQLNFCDLRKYGISSVILNADTDVIDTTFVEKINRHGLQIILNIDSLSHSKSYYKDLESIVQKYKIKYLLFYNTFKENDDKINQNRDENIEQLRSLIVRHDLVFFLVENREQTGYMSISGVDSLISGTNYRINRAFSISNYFSRIKTPQDASMIWLRAVMDRNIRMVLIEPIYPSKDYAFKNHISDTLDASKQLYELLHLKGFVANGSIQQLNPNTPGMPFNIFIIINIIVSIALILDYSKINERWILIFLLTMPFFLSILIFGVIRPDTNIWAAFAASITYPSLSSIVLLNSMKNVSKNIIKLICLSLLRIFSINGIGVCIVIASMCDVRYLMGLVNYNLVIPAFIIPLVVFSISFIIAHPIYKKIVKQFINKGFLRFVFSNLIYIFIGSIFITIYLLRSGNYNILPEFNAELEVRKLLELTMSARPRTKEFIVGYPCLFAFLFLYTKKVSYKVLCFLGTFSSIIGISIINSFCHGFTPVITSLNRTFNGLLLGIITGCISLITCIVLGKIK